MTADPIRLAMDLFEYRLLDSPVRFDKEAQPIVFDFVAPTRQTWSFDPHSAGRLFTPRDIADAPLRLRCTGDLVLRLLTDPTFEVRPEDQLSWDGDIDVLATLHAGLEAPQSSLGLRVARTKRED